ncbi:MAG: hypothetical protein ACP5H8_03370, partial [Candidatus Micrarchaeia archaeon]
NKKSFVNYTIGAGLVMRAIYEEGDENTKDLIKSAIVTMMSGENLFAKLSATSLVLVIPIREYYTMTQLVLLDLMLKHGTSKTGSEIAKFAKGVADEIKEDQEKNPVEQVIPNEFFFLRSLTPKPLQKSDNK